MITDLDQYQVLALRTAGQHGENGLACWALGLTGEAGETADLIKKALFHGKRVDRIQIARELGDTLWYLAVLSHELGFTLSEVAQLNIDKLIARYPEGFTSQASEARIDETGN